MRNILIPNKENYHYACEKLKKDQERLRKSSYKQRKITGEERPSTRGRRNVSKPPPSENTGKHPYLKRKEPVYRPPSAVIRKNLVRKNTENQRVKKDIFDSESRLDSSAHKQRKPNLNFSHSNVKKKNTDLDEVLSIAEETANKFNKVSIRSSYFSGE